VLAADENFSPFFAFIAKTRPKPPFGIPRALQPPKTNIITFSWLFCFVLIPTARIIFDALSH
jgi:hypothetical protein